MVITSPLPKVYINYGVPQGSILGPLLFLLYVNDIHNINASHNSIKQYADDTCLIISALNFEKMKTEANSLLLLTEKWSAANKLTINISKSKAMVVAPKLKTSTSTTTATLFIGNSPIQIVNSFRYLGVILDNKLSFQDHISSIEKKVARSVGIITKLRHYVPNTILLKLYFALLHPHLLYGILVWGSTYKSYMQKLISLQNKAIRLITNNLAFHQPIVPVSALYKHKEIFKLSDLYLYEVASFMHNFSNSKLPNAFLNYFIKTDAVHTLRTRQHTNSKFFIPRYRTSRLQHSIKYQGIKIWHSISSDLRKTSFKRFRKSLKNYLLALY